jgi:hypothetical protein
MRAQVVVQIVSLALLLPLAAAAQRTASGAGTPTAPGVPAEAIGKEGPTTTGIQTEGLLGTGFSGTYGLGLGARVGYALDNGLYAGGGGTYFIGHHVETAMASGSAYAWFLGGELGYIFYPTKDRTVTIRPFVFGGPGVVRTIDEVPFRAVKAVGFAIEPGVLGAYHFGHGFVSAEARYHVSPTPGAFALFLGGGLAF